MKVDEKDVRVKEGVDATHDLDKIMNVHDLDKIIKAEMSQEEADALERGIDDGCREIGLTGTGYGKKMRGMTSSEMLEKMIPFLNDEDKERIRNRLSKVRHENYDKAMGILYAIYMEGGCV